MKKYITNNELETIEFGYNFAKKLALGNIVILSGDLGSGKTKLVQGILKYFDLENEISSPTFTIVNEYISPKQKIYHFDLYRLDNIDEFYELGGEEYFKNGICIFEWGEILESELKQPYIKITYEKDPDDFNKRILYVEEVI